MLSILLFFYIFFSDLLEFFLNSQIEWPWVGYPLYGMVKIPKWVVPTPTKMRKMGTTHTKNEYYPFLVWVHSFFLVWVLPILVFLLYHTVGTQPTATLFTDSTIYQV